MDGGSKKCDDETSKGGTVLNSEPPGMTKLAARKYSTTGDLITMPEDGGWRMHF